MADSKELSTAAPDRALQTSDGYQAVDMAALMRVAVDKGPDGVEALERLVALQEQQEAKWARRQFADALAAFQSAAPTVRRYKSVPGRDGSPRYRYAPLESIVGQVGAHLRAHGFSFRFDTQHDGDGVTVSCILTHVDGHSEASSVRMPGVQVPQANSAQCTGAAVTYGKRQAFLNATGLLTADQDTDGVPADDGAGVGDGETISEAQALDLQALVEDVGADRERFLRYLGVTRLSDLRASRYDKAVAALEAKRER